MKNLKITFNLAANGVQAREAYRLYCRTLNSLPPFPVLLLKKPPEAFMPENCMVALAENRVIGCALLVKPGNPEAFLPKIRKKFGKAAEECMRTVCTRMDPAMPVFEIGSICVDPAFRNRGIARHFYEMAAARAAGNIYAIVTKENAASRAAARAANFNAAPGSAHVVRFSIKDGVAMPEPGGFYPAAAEIFMPLPE